jgi:structural maintenance of chromosomes protein 5
LNRVFNDTPEALGRKIRINNWYRAPVDIGRPPFSPEEVCIGYFLGCNIDLHISQMRELGFDGCALDFIQCPEGLKYFLQLELQLHRTVRVMQSSTSFAYVNY